MEGCANLARDSGAIVASLTVAELLVGARDGAAEGLVMELLARLPVVVLDREVG